MRENRVIDRQALIEDYIDACTNCGSREFPKRADCDGCAAAADEEIERRMAEADRFSAITASIAMGS